MRRKCLNLSSNPFNIYVENVEKYWPGAKVYVFGSVARGRYTAGSDIDMLVVVESYDKEEKYKFRAEIAMTTDLPIQLHVATRKEFEKWHLRFIPQTKLIEV